MRKVKIITDTCSDLTPALLNQYDIDYAKMSIVEDGVESPAPLDWDAQTYHEFYDKIRNGKHITTSQVPIAEFERIFTQYLDNGYDIVYIACSSKQSGSVNNGAVVAKKLLANYPNAKVFCIDSLNASIGEGMLAIEAAKMVRDGVGAEEICDRIISIRKNVREYFTVHTLEYFKRAGRVSASSAFFGNLMGVKPIVVSDADGRQAAFKKVKGRQNSIKELVTLTKESIREAKEQTIYVVQSDTSKDDIDMLTELLKQEIDCRDICVLTLGPIIGATSGPDALGVLCFGEKVTFVGGND